MWKSHPTRLFAIKLEVQLSADEDSEGGYLLNSEEWGQFIGMKHKVLFGQARVKVSGVCCSVVQCIAV